MAKTRRSRPVKKPRQAGAKARAKTPPKKKKQATTTAVKPAASPKTIELKQLRAQFASMLSVLSTRRSADPAVAAKLDTTRRRVSQWMSDIDDICDPQFQEICGPDMAFPLS